MTRRDSAEASRLLAALASGKPHLTQAAAEKHGADTGWEVARPITRWRLWLLTQAQIAELFSITTRQVQNLEAKGLPAEGERSSKRYPWPDASAWFFAYVRAGARAQVRGGSVEPVTVRIARAEYEDRIERDLRRELDGMLDDATVVLDD